MPNGDADPPKPPGRLRRSARAVAAFQPRVHLWNLIDYFEARPKLLGRLVLALAALMLAGAGAGYGYVRWHRTNSIRIARQWLAAGRLDRAQAAVQTAITQLPARPEPWALAAELAWRNGQKQAALAYAEHAAQMSHEQFDYVLTWAESAVLANQPAAAAGALAKMDPTARAGSARAQRVAGEIARQTLRYPEARDHFAAALKLDLASPDSARRDRVGIDEIPLGLVELRTGDPADHQRGLERLTRLAANPIWGAEALRELLSDALSRKDHPATIQWAEALRAHPRCVLSDLPECLLALSVEDETRFRAMLTPLEGEFGHDPNRIALLVGWLNQIGRPDVGLRWAQSLPDSLTMAPPAVLLIAEALRKTARWKELATWVTPGPWGPDTEFLRSAYRLNAASALGDKAATALAWSTLQSQVQNRGDFAMFAGANLYAWGLRPEAITLLWIAADRPNVAIEALGTILRHYQLMHDAAGEYRAFKRLHSLRPADPAIAHDFVFFAVLTGQYDYAEIERLARDNFRRDPDNALYRANYAFLLDSTGRSAEGLALLDPKAEAWHTVQGFAFAYGLALAHNGQREKARTVLASVDVRTLSRQEKDLIQAAMR